MSFRHAAFWSIIGAVEVILILWISTLAAFSPKPTEPVDLGDAKVPAPAGVSSRAKIVPPAQESRALRIRIEARQVIGKYLKLRGWAYIDNHQTRGQIIYIQIERPDGTVVRYRTARVERPDVGERFKNPLYNSCGFKALIPLPDGFALDRDTIRLVVKNRGDVVAGAPLKAGTRTNSSPSH